MRHLRMTIGFAAVVCACAVFSAPALAKEFTASRLPHPCSEAEPCKTKGVGIGTVDEARPEYTQQFKFGSFTIECKTAASKAATQAEGAITWSTSQIFATEVKFGGCKTLAKFGTFTGAIATKFNNGLPVKFVYHVNGFVEEGSGETESEVEVGGAASSFKIGGKICTISWPAQTVPATAVKKPEGEFSAAAYSDNVVPVTVSNHFPTGLQEKLVIANKFRGMSWEYEEGQCVGEGGFEEEAPKTEAKTGQFTGTFEESVNAGNLGFKA
jgi:hypothetical protein